MSEMTSWQATDIPLTLITGMLGVGKTTLIADLLSRRPENERWAVLVNEFSRMGMDADRLRLQDTWVREVAGGCMGCAAAVPMQIEMNRLIREARPHRVLVEPTGLGHPAELLAIFRRPEYQSVFSTRTTLCLVDARDLHDNRRLNPVLWHQQLEAADRIIGNKTALWSEKDWQAFDGMAAVLRDSGRLVEEINQGCVEQAWLDQPIEEKQVLSLTQLSLSLPAFADKRLPDNQQFHWHSQNIQLDSTLSYPDINAIQAIFSRFDWVRIKGCLRQPEGGWQLDGVHGELTVRPMPATNGNTLVVISTSRLPVGALQADMEKTGRKD